MPAGIFKLENVLQEYSWGSTTYIPEFLGLENKENTPLAEMWMGMHPRGESKVQIGSKRFKLSRLVEEDPEGILGKGSASRFGGKLPFLFKVLAAGKPLSIQAHPSLKQAAEGFARENSAAIPLDAPYRNYRDDNHKPELIYALTPFWALRGFRPVDEILVEFLSLSLQLISIELDQLKHSPGREGLKVFFQFLVTLEGEKKEKILGEVLQAIDKREESRFKWVKKLHREYPGDIGILSPLLLHCIRLEPGQAMFLPAGELHAYLEGFGIELMANSDNVLRGGLTGKYIDVPELVKTLTFDFGPVEFLQPGISKMAGGTEEIYKPPVDEFQLSKITLGENGAFTSAKKRNGEILLCTEGPLHFREAGSDSELRVEKGESVIVYSRSPGYSIRGTGTVFKAGSS